MARFAYFIFKNFEILNPRRLRLIQIVCCWNEEETYWGSLGHCFCTNHSVVTKNNCCTHYSISLVEIGQCNWSSLYELQGLAEIVLMDIMQKCLKQSNSAREISEIFFLRKNERHDHTNIQGQGYNISYKINYINKRRPIYKQCSFIVKHHSYLMPILALTEAKLLNETGPRRIEYYRRMSEATTPSTLKPRWKNGRASETADTVGTCTNTDTTEAAASSLRYGNRRAPRLRQESRWLLLECGMKVLIMRRYVGRL